MAKSKDIPDTIPSPEGPVVCAKCGAEIGPKVIPVNHDGSIYCPKCFVHSVIQSVPQLYAPGFAAVKCTRCETEAMVPQGARCPNCRWRILTVLPRG